MFYFSSSWLTTLYNLLLRYEQQLMWLRESDAKAQALLTSLPDYDLQSSLSPQQTEPALPPFPIWDCESLGNYLIMGCAINRLAPNDDPHLQTGSLEHQEVAELNSKWNDLCESVGTTQELESWYRLWYRHLTNQFHAQSKSEVTNNCSTSDACTPASSSQPQTSHQNEIEEIDSELAQELSELKLLQELLNSEPMATRIEQTLDQLKAQVLTLIATCHTLEANLQALAPQPLTSYENKSEEGRSRQLIIYHCNKFNLYQELYNQAGLHSHPTYIHGLLPAIAQAQHHLRANHLIIYGINLSASALSSTGLFNLQEVLSQLDILKVFVNSKQEEHHSSTSEEISDFKDELSNQQLKHLALLLQSKLATSHLIPLELYRSNRDREFGFLTKILRSCLGWLPKLLFKDLPRCLRTTKSQKLLQGYLVTLLQHAQANQALSETQLKELSYALYSFFVTDINNWLIQKLERKQQHESQAKQLTWEYWYPNNLATSWFGKLRQSWQEYNFMAQPQEQLAVTWRAPYKFNYPASYFNQLDAPNLVHETQNSSRLYQQLGYTLAHYHYWGINLCHLDWTRWWVSNQADIYDQQIVAKSTLGMETPNSTQVLIPNVGKMQLQLHMGNWADADIRGLQVSMNDYVKQQYGILTTASMQHFLDGYQEYFDNLQA